VENDRPNWMRLRLRELAAVEPGEVRPLGWSFTYFFALLCSYYIIRPMRDEVGISGGVDRLQWMFSGTVLVMPAAVPLFGWVPNDFRCDSSCHMYIIFLSPTR
jgi:AAA family ATP:ADP antiporter